MSGESESHGTSSPTAIPPEDLLDDLRRVADDLGRSPTRMEYEEHGAYSAAPFRTQFGGWNGGKEAAGLETTPWKGQKISDEVLLEDLRHMADELGRAPTTEDIKNSGSYSLGPYYERFESWGRALDEAGIEPSPEQSIHFLEGDDSPTPCPLCGKGYTADLPSHLPCDGGEDDESESHGTRGRPPIPKGDLLDDLRRVADELGHSPSKDDYRTHGEYSSNTLINKFGSWNESKEAAGLETYPVGGPK